MAAVPVVPRGEDTLPAPPKGIPVPVVRRTYSVADTLWDHRTAAVAAPAAVVVVAVEVPIGFVAVDHLFAAVPAAVAYRPDEDRVVIPEVAEVGTADTLHNWVGGSSCHFHRGGHQGVGGVECFRRGRRIRMEISRRVRTVILVRERNQRGLSRGPIIPH